MNDTSDLSVAQTLLLLAKAISLNTAAMQAMTESNLILAGEIAQANAPTMDEVEDEAGMGATDMAGRRVGGRN